MADKKTLKDRIKEEMMVDYSNSLEKTFDLARKYVRVTKDGKIDVMVKDKIGGKEQLLLYMIGKLYAKEAGFSASDCVDNKELMEELGIPKGSMLPWLKDLRDGNKIKQVKNGKNVHHVISVNIVEKTLKIVEKKLDKS